MTDIEVLEETKKHWKYMRDNDPTDKSCYKPAKEWHNRCLLCESSNGNCVDCVMHGSWGGASKTVIPCCETNINSVYLIWEYDKSRETCQGIVDALQRKIDSLKLKETSKSHPSNQQSNPLGLHIGEEFLVRDDGDIEWNKYDFAGYLKYGQTTMWFVGYPDQDILRFDQAKLIPKTKAVVKSATEIMRILVAEGYAVDSGGDWCTPGSGKRFTTRMWVSCGKEPNTNWNWEPEWLEEVPIKSK